MRLTRKSTTDPLAHVTSYGYNHVGWLTSETLPDPDGAGGLSAPVTTYGYDVLGRRTSLTDPTGNVTSWAYDGLSRVTSETNELSETRTFEYNAASQLTKRTDRRGLAREFSYDNVGRMTAEVWKNGGSTVRTISFAYNAGSALTSASDADSSYAYTYDNLGRVTNVDNNGTSGVPRVQLASAYDANGNRTSVSATITTTLDLLNSYTYDGLNRLTRLDQTGQTGGNSVAEKRVDFAYNARSQFSSIARYKDTDGGSTHEVATSTFAYDNIGRLTALDHKHSTTNLANYDWTYDAASRVTQFAYAHLVGGSGTSDYSYDHTNQVTAANHSGITDEAYSFDASGNRTNTGYSTGDNNQLLSDGTFDYTYDDEGNRLTRTRISSSPADDKTVEFTWDHRNRLTQVKNKDDTNATTQVVEYIYDLYDRKIGRKVDSDGDADWDSVERYIYDLDDVILEFLDADGDGAGSQALSKRCLWGPAVDQLLAQEDLAKSLSADDRVLWPLTDNLGSVRDLVDQTGDIVNHIEYDSFGKPARVLDGAANSVSLSSLPTRYLYTTREYDSLTDLQYNRARWYDPSTGKWLSLDPIGFAAGDTTLDRYVGNSPVRFGDPSGLDKVFGDGGIGNEVPIGGVRPPPARPTSPAPPSLPPIPPEAIDSRGGGLAVELWGMYGIRSVLGLFVIPQLWQRCPETDVIPDDGTAARASRAARDDFFIQYALQQGVPVDGQWHSIRVLPSVDIVPMAENPIDTSGNSLSAGAVGGPHKVIGGGTYEIRMTAGQWLARPDGSRYRLITAEVRRVNMFWTWHDEMDANSWLELYRRGHFGDSPVRSVCEGGVDIVLDKTLGAGFPFVIEWTEQSLSTYTLLYMQNEDAH